MRQRDTVEIVSEINDGKKARQMIKEAHQNALKASDERKTRVAVDTKTESVDPSSVVIS